MAAADSVFESLQRLQSMIETFGESLSKLCKDNESESVCDLWKNLVGCYYDLHKALQSRYETLEIKEKKPEYEALKITEKNPEEPGTREQKKEKKTSTVNVSRPASSSFTKVLSSVEVRPEIKTLCDKADGRGLINYIVDNREEVETLRNELPVVLSKAPDAAKLVLKALEAYDFSKSGTNLKEKTECLCSANRRACILLLESLFPVFGNDESGLVPSDVKDSAREIAKIWRKEMKIEKKAGSVINQLDVQAFLQLLVTFRIAVDYEKDELWRLLRVILNLRQAPELCRSLGLSSKVPTLLRSPFMALRYAHVLGMMDKIDPVGLVTSYLRGAEEGAKALLENGHGSAESQMNANNKMLCSIQNVIKLIEEYDLQSHFCEDDLQNKLRILVQEKEELEKKRTQDAEKKAQEKHVEKNTQEEEDRKKAAEKKTQEEEDRRKAAEKKAQDEEDRKKAAEKKAQEKGDKDKAAKKKAQEEEDRKKAAEKKAQEKEDREKAAKKKAQEKGDKEKAAKKKAQEEENRKKAAEKRAQEKEDREKAAKKKAQEEEDRKKAAEKKAQEKEDREKAAEKKAQVTEDRKKAAEKMLQHKRFQSFEPGHGPLERENYASKKAKHASPNVTTRVTGGMGNSKASPCNIDGVQKKSGIIGHDHLTSAFSAANRSSTGVAAGALTSAPSIAAQVNDERRYCPSAFGTSNLTPIGSSLYGSSVPAGAFAVPLYNVAGVNYEGRGQQSYPMNLGEVDKNHIRASVYGTGDLAKSFATQSNYNYEGRGQESCKLNFGEVDNNPVTTSAYGTGVLANSDATQTHYGRRGSDLYTSTFGGGNTGSIGSSVYGLNSCAIPSSDVNQGGHERSLGQYPGFAGRTMVPIESSGYRPRFSTVSPFNVTQGHFESRSATDKYRFNSGLTSLPPTY